MRTRRAGFTLLETVIALAIFGIVMGAGVVAMQAGQRSFRQTMANTVANSKANRALNRIAKKLTGARQISVVISPDAESVTFQEVAGWVGNDPVWSNDSEIRFEYERGELNNGIDDNGNGFVDEGRIVLVEDQGEPEERSVVLVNSIREFLEGEEPNGADDNGNGIDDERGLCFQLQGDSIVIRLTVQRRDSDGRVVMRTLSTTVGMRN